MGAMQRRKGASFEREVAKLFTEALRVDCRRGLVQCRSSSEAADVELPPEVPLWLECKHHKKVNLHDALAQADEACDKWVIVNQHIEEPKWPAAIVKDNGKAPLAVMYAEDFAKMMGHYLTLYGIAKAWRLERDENGIKVEGS
jgi:hypothetical protein